jgi:hypothetical protein
VGPVARAGRLAAEQVRDGQVAAPAGGPAPLRTHPLGADRLAAEQVRDGPLAAPAGGPARLLAHPRLAATWRA